jgi:large exoprotein involved in heme utilization and adhesion
VSRGSGEGGNVELRAHALTLRDGATLSAESTGTGNAGNITIAIQDSFVSTNGSVVTRATQTDGGNIQITASNFLRLRNSRITAEVGGGPQTMGGNITIDPQFVLLQNSQIVANAFEGHGGNLRISAQQVFLADPSSQVSASSLGGPALQGTVDIRAPVTSISQTVAPLPQSFARVAELLRNRCAERLRGGTVSRFVLGGRDGVPLEPGSWLPSAPGPLGQQHTAPSGQIQPERQPDSVGVLQIDNAGQAQVKGQYAQAQWPGALDVECARWMGTHGTGGTHRR